MNSEAIEEVAQAGCTLLSNDNVPVALDVTELAAVEIHHQLSEPRTGGGEVHFHFSFLSRPHWRPQPEEIIISSVSAYTVHTKKNELT